MPGIVAGTEWAAYYDDLAAAFGLTIEVPGPDFGTEPLLDEIADSSVLATFVGDQTRLVWPAGYDLRRIAVRDPTPVYPHSLIWRGDNPHPALATLRTYLGSLRSGRCDAETWVPKWAHEQSRRSARRPPRHEPYRRGRLGGTGNPDRTLQSAVTARWTLSRSRARRRSCSASGSSAVAA